jgi:hypothetical protein
MGALCAKFYYKYKPHWVKKHSSEFTKIAPEYLQTDASSLISISTPQDVEKTRARLIEVLWGGPLPARLPDRTESVSDPRWGDLKIEKITVKMDFGLESVIYHFFAEKPTKKLLLYHQGHNEQDFIDSKRQIRKFLASGYDVMAFALLLKNQNSQPIVDVPQQGKLKLTTHDQMKFLTPEKGNPVKYFIEPVIVALNGVKANYHYEHIFMTGISGGGWSTTLAAAIDPRIEKSFPVAGSFPIYLRADRDWGDYENTIPAIYNSVNYLDLYILGSYGAGRKQVQITNQFDACCFAGVKWKTYVGAVESRMHELGSGEYDLFMDSSHGEHKISDVALERMLRE